MSEILLNACELGPGQLSTAKIQKYSRGCTEVVWKFCVAQGIPYIFPRVSDSMRWKGTGFCGLINPIKMHISDNGENPICFFYDSTKQSLNVGGEFSQVKKSVYAFAVEH